MQIIPRLVLALAMVTATAFAASLHAAVIEKRIALVIGNAAYRAGALATSANDAGLVAQTLQAAGFDVIGARDLDGESLRRAFKDFIDKAAAAGPGTVAIVYLAGYGLQLDGENYFAPVDAKIGTAADVPSEALRVSDYTKRLSALQLDASLIILDGARSSPFATSGESLAGGFALMDADPRMLIAFNATPGSVAPAETGPYGAYATALAEMIREGGLSISELFDRLRLRVNEVTKGAEVPWSVTRIDVPFVFFERAADAPPPVSPIAETQAISAKPIRALGAEDAYAAALYRDTLRDYEDFLTAYPNDPMAARVRAIVALRREAITWRRTCHTGTPNAYWSYLGRYPRGPHAANARWRLAHLSAAVEPPPTYAPIIYDVPPPLPAEIVYVDRPVVVFSDPVYAFVPPPPPPVVFLPPMPAAFMVLPPPPPPVMAFALPDPPFVPVPAWVNPPPYVAPPPNNMIFNNIHNETIINAAPSPTMVNPPGAPVASQPAGIPGAAIGAAAIGAGAVAGAAAARVPLPPSMAQRAQTLPGVAPHDPAGSRGVPGLAQPGQPLPGGVKNLQVVPPPNGLPIGHTLPGADGHAPPAAGIAPPTAPVPGRPGQAAAPPSPGAGPGHPPQGASAQPSSHTLPGTDGRILPPTGAAPPTAPSLGKPSSFLPTKKGTRSDRPQGKLARPPGMTSPPAAVASPPAAPTRPEPALPPRQAMPLGQPPRGGPPAVRPPSAHSPRDLGQPSPFPRNPMMPPQAQSQPVRIQPAPTPPRPPQPSAGQFQAQPGQPHPQPMAPHPQPATAPHPPQAPQQKPPCGQPGHPPCH